MVEQEIATSRSGETTPLCMEQYLRIFNAYRQPGAGQDVQVVTDPLAARDSEHVIVTGNKGQVRPEVCYFMDRVGRSERFPEA